MGRLNDIRRGQQKLPAKNKATIRAIKKGEHVFRSRTEEAFYSRTLLPQEKDGKIRELKVAPLVKELVPKIGWSLDFSYIRADDGVLVYVDVKGVQRRDTELKQRLWATFGPKDSELQIVKELPGTKNTRFYISDIIVGQGFVWSLPSESPSKQPGS